MNAKKAKALRRAARQVAQTAGLPEDLLLKNTKTGVIRNGRSLRGVYQHMKGLVEAGKLTLAPRASTPQKGELI